MADVHRLPEVKSTERQASEWIARLNAHDVSPEDRARFAAWRNAHPLHARLYEELSDTWRQFTAAGPLIRAVSFAQSMQEAANARVPRPRVALIAASVAAVALVSWLYVARLAPDTIFKTTVGEHATISLPDGSTLELNSSSLARIDYSERSRVIHLERGEAYFKVMHDVDRPFWVVGGGSWVRAVGTAFNVYVRSSGVVLTVSEGTVKVGAQEHAGDGMPSDDVLSLAGVALVTAGQQAQIRNGAAATRKLTQAELSRSVAWRDGTLYFENQPLGEVIDELGRYTTLKLVVEDNELRALPVGGTFQASPQGAEALLSMLEQGFSLRVRRENSRVYIDGESSDHSK